MGSSNIPDNDAQYLQWIRNFANVAAADPGSVGMTQEQAEALAVLADEFSEAYLESQHYKILARAKIAQKETARRASEEAFRGYAKLISNNFMVSGENKVKLGMNATAAPPSPVQTPEKLVVVCQPTGINQLTWKPNGNSRSVRYLIECKPVERQNWEIVGMTATLKFNHMVGEIGEPLLYRVSAQRSKVKSVPSIAVLTPYASRRAPGTLRPAA